MSTVSASVAPAGGIRRLIQAHPLVSYFTLAYLLSWLAVSPVVLAAGGLGVLPFRLSPTPFLTLGAIVGPTLSAWIVTYASQGMEGLKSFLRRYLRLKTGIQWYLIALLGFPLLYLVAASLVTGFAPLAAALQNWPLLFTVYGVVLVGNLVQVTMWEEPGWRGFALPRLQSRFGPLAGTLILGFLWAMWHLPAYFVTGWMGPFNPGTMILNLILTTILTILFTWVFNGSGGVFLIAMLLHASSNATSAYLARLLPSLPPSGSLAIVAALVLVSLLVLLLTRGRLAYNKLDTE